MPASQQPSPKKIILILTATVLLLLLGLRIFDGLYLIVFSASIPIFACTIYFTSRKALRDEALLMKLSQYESLFDSLPDLVWIKDEKSRFLMVNKHFTKTFGRPVEDFIGKNDFDFCPKEQAQSYADDDEKVLQSGQSMIVEEVVTLEKGEKGWSETRKNPVFDKNGKVVGTVGLVRDITERKQAEILINHMANHDDLTGLPNRRYFESELENHFTSSHNDGRSFAVLFVDIDNFKAVNDSMGHLNGDKVICEVAKRLNACIPSNAIAARIGGDEFTIVIVDVKDTNVVRDFCDKLLNLSKTPLFLDEEPVEIFLSIGVAMYPGDADDQRSLIKAADVALYQAKQNGRNQVAFFDPNNEETPEKQLKRVQELKRAIENEEFIAYFQGQYDANSGELVGLEALARWKHSKKGILGPAAFIDFAESSHYVVDIDQMIFEQVCRQIQLWCSQGLNPPVVSVNVSTLDLQSPSFLRVVRECVEKYEIPKGQIDVEVTERMIVDDPSRTAEVMHSLKDLGMMITIDDFGTGYSNLNYLINFPIDRIKIDRSFICEITHSNAHKIIVKSILQLASDFGFEVVGEGAERKEEVDILNELGCRIIQGYYFSKPEAEKETRKRIESVIKSETE